MDRMIKVHSVRHAAPQSNLYTEAAVEEPLGAILVVEDKMPYILTDCTQKIQETVSEGRRC